MNSEVDLTLEGGQKIVAVITNVSAEALGLKTGLSAFAIVKANEVIVGKGAESGKFSARNVLAGKVSNVDDGAVSSEVSIALAGGSEVVATITKSSVVALDLKAGDSVSAIIKASNVILGV